MIWRVEVGVVLVALEKKHGVPFTESNRACCQRTVLWPSSRVSFLEYAPDNDTPTGQVVRVPLDADGWPEGEPVVWLDLTVKGLNPDGAVFDAEGRFWLAEWGAARVACYGADGHFIEAVGFDAPHTSCPAFGGPDLSTLYCTTALQGMDAAARAANPSAGMTFAAKVKARGQAEHRVILP